jgi:hypothetical protein
MKLRIIGFVMKLFAYENQKLHKETPHKDLREYP